MVHPAASLKSQEYRQPEPLTEEPQLSLSSNHAGVKTDPLHHETELLFLRKDEVTAEGLPMQLHIRPATVCRSHGIYHRILNNLGGVE
jgi:hypothetical protein